MRPRTLLGPQDSTSKNGWHAVFHPPLRRFWHILYILYYLEIGFILIFLPWLRIWESNYLVYRYPILHPIVANPFLKGAVLGLGIVNLLIGLQEIASLRKNSPKSFSN